MPAAGNKPTTDEINTCNRFLRAELTSLPEASLILALGLIAHKATIKAWPEAGGLCLRPRRPACPAQRHAAAGFVPLQRYNTQTRRLTTPMFEKIFHQARQLIGT